MKCPKCQSDNREGVKFCEKCGTKMELHCANCGAKIPLDSQFCGECGHNLALPSEPSPKSPPKDLSFDEKLDKIQRYLPKGLTEKILSQRDRIEGERKQVTVMFCDMEGFTQLSERLGPEEAYSIMDQVYEILIHKVHDYEGTVNEMTGDGIMALFGAPIALEDAPQRAIRSGLAIHREMVRFSDKIRAENMIPPLRMRIGIHTGPVVVGTLGNDLRVEFKAVGDTVNLASRIEGLADPGATYVTEDTFKLTEGLFRFEALGELEVKGKEEAVKTYRVIAPSTRRTRFDVSAERGLTPFVGRERELELLLDSLERSKAGRGQAFSIVGEAGVGKSRLLYEFRKAVINEDVTFLEGKCLSYSRGVAYHPVIDILKSSFDIQEDDGDLEIREKVTRGLKAMEADEASTLPYLLELLSVKDSGIDKISMSPEAKKDRIIEALNRVVLKSSEIRPLIMAIEDLHWIDKSSEERFKSLLETISGARIFLIFTYRPEFVHTWGGRSYHSQVNLNQLSNRESLAMVANLLGTEDIGRDLEELILEKTEGVPFFIEEFVKSLKELKVIERKDNKYHLTKDIQHVTIPVTIQDVIMARVDSLPEAAKALLQTGSVIEREFSYELIKRVTVTSQEELLSYLSVLKDSELLYERGIYPQSTYIFKHALTQEVAYNSLLLKKRKEIHEQIGKATEELYPERLEELYEMLAYHYSKSDNLEKSIQYLKFSGEKAAKNYANSEALVFYKEAISVLNKMQKNEENKNAQIEVRILMGNTLFLLGYPEDSLQILQEGERLAKEVGDKKSLAGFCGHISSLYSFKGDQLLAKEYAEKSFREANKIQDVDLMAPPAMSLCNTFMRIGQHLKVIDMASKVIDLIEKTERESDFFGLPYNAYSAFCVVYGMSKGMLGNFDEGVAFFEKGLGNAAKIGNLVTLGASEGWYALLLRLKGDGKLSIEHSQKSIKYLEEGNWPFGLGVAWSNLGYGYYLLGELGAAQKHIEKGLKIQSDYNIEQGLCHYYIGLSMVHCDSGDLIKAQSYVEKALELTQKNNERAMEGISKIWLGRILGKKDPSQGDKAEEFIQEGIRILNGLGIKPYSAQGYLFLGEFYADATLKEKANEYLKKAEGMFNEMGMDYWPAKVHEVLDRL